MASWKKLDIDDLRLILSEDEVQRLDTLALDESITAVINDTLDLLANMWRGALSAKGYTLDIRSETVPPEYQYWVLVHARYACWTRFPNSGAFALDDTRKDEYNKAMQLLKDPYIATSKPAWENDPSNPDNKDENYWHAAASIVVPYPMVFEGKSNIQGELWN